MTREETQGILKVLRISYPNSFNKMSNEDTFLFLDMWHTAFKDDDVNLVISAVKSIIYSDTREFAPNIAQVKKEMELIGGENRIPFMISTSEHSVYDDMSLQELEKLVIERFY